MSITRALLMAVAVLAVVSPVLAQEVELKLTLMGEGYPGRFAVVKPGGGDINGWQDSGYVRDITDWAGTGATFGVSTSALSCSIGSLTLSQDTDAPYGYSLVSNSINFLPIRVDTSDYVKTVAGEEVTVQVVNFVMGLQMAPVHVNMSGYMSGYWIWELGGAGKSGNLTYNLPLEFSNLYINMAGSNNYFSRDTVNGLTVGSATNGLVFTAGVNAANEDTLTLSPDCVIPLDVTIDGDRNKVGWFRSGSSPAGTGPDININNPLNYVQGDYIMQCAMVAENRGFYVGGTQNFTVPVGGFNPDGTQWSWTVIIQEYDNNVDRNPIDVFHYVTYTGPVPLPVPEPATMTLLALGGLVLLRRGRR